MKELDINLLQKFKQKTQLEVKQQKKQEFKYVYQGTIIPHEGHTLWEIDLETLEVTEAEYLKQDYVFDWNWKKGDPIKTESKVIVNQGCAYVSALNPKNALKKLHKGSNGTKIDITKSYLNL